MVLPEIGVSKWGVGAPWVGAQKLAYKALLTVVLKIKPVRQFWSGFSTWGGFSTQQNLVSLCFFCVLIVFSMLLLFQFTIGIINFLNSVYEWLHSTHECINQSNIEIKSELCFGKCKISHSNHIFMSCQIDWVNVVISLCFQKWLLYSIVERKGNQNEKY